MFLTSKKESQIEDLNFFERTWKKGLTRLFMMRKFKQRKKIEGREIDVEKVDC